MSKRRGVLRAAVVTSLGFVLAGAVACASQAPSSQLVDARQTYSQAYTSANEQVPDLVYDAQVALERAEAEHSRDPGSDEEKHLAYIAHRRALYAMAQADEREALKAQQNARQHYQALLLSQREAARAALEDARRELEGERVAARTLEDALESLRDVADVEAEEKQVTITLTGAVLFKTDEWELLPIATDRLEKVAEALSEFSPGQKIVVEGHADSRGPAEYNQQLSQRRAEAVKLFLVDRGMDPERIEAVGKGESDPLATNETPSGRAMNRRVEIVVAE